MPTTSPKQQSLPRRFYKSVSATAGPHGWQIELDGRPVKTFGKADLLLPTDALAQAVAAEWDAQAERIDPASMPVTRFVNVAIDRTPETRDMLADEVVKYIETDLVCHLAESPAELRERQEATWRPLRDWAGRELGILLVPVEGIIAPAQPDASKQAARDHALSLDDFRLTALGWATSLYGSAILALAVERGEIDAEDAFERSRVDEAWQIEQWGEDAEAMAATENRRRDARTLGQLFTSLLR